MPETQRVPWSRPCRGITGDQRNLTVWKDTHFLFEFITNHKVSYSMKIKDLVGEHLLSGVDISTEPTKRKLVESARVIRFVLDGTTYKAIEDPDDGELSFLQELKVTDEKVTNTFEPQKVIGKMKENNTYTTNDTIQFTNAVTGEIVLEVGTDEVDDYYPNCVMNWYPENIKITS